MTDTEGAHHIVSERQTENQPRIKVVIVGAGKGGVALLESFLTCPEFILSESRIKM
jgi:chemotaxis response regulator CheB